MSGHDSSRPARREQPSPALVVSKAVLRAAERLNLSHKAVARMLGVSPATVSRMAAGTYVLNPADKPFELALLFLRLFRSLDAIVAGDDASARAWLRHPHAVLGDAPGTLILSLPGLVNVVGYVDARRALA